MNRKILNNTITINYIQTELCLQSIATKCTKVGSQQPSKQPLEVSADFFNEVNSPRNSRNFRWLFLFATCSKSADYNRSILGTIVVFASQWLFSPTNPGKDAILESVKRNPGDIIIHSRGRLNPSYPSVSVPGLDLRAQKQKTQSPPPPPESPTLLLPVSIVKRPLQLRRLFVVPVPV
jgi:hypothetical protein